jgi:hypothetical protein
VATAAAEYLVDSGKWLSLKRTEDEVIVAEVLETLVVAAEFLEQVAMDVSGVVLKVHPAQGAEHGHSDPGRRGGDLAARCSLPIQPSTTSD